MYVTILFLGSETHFKVIVVSDAFDKKPLIQVYTFCLLFIYFRNVCITRKKLDKIEFQSKNCKFVDFAKNNF